MQLHKKKTSISPHLFVPTSNSHGESIQQLQGVVQFLRWRVRVKARVKAFGLPRVLHQNSAILGRGNC